MRRGRKRATAGFVLFTAPRPAGHPTRVGITVSKAVGIAVLRNRTRRRVKTVLDALDRGALPVADLLFVMRPGSADLAYAALAAEVARALVSV